ncbi:MAG: hypothetical protein RL385_2883 [Pseudomonadota bacterium]|jgi:hypothetical protein
MVAIWSSLSTKLNLPCIGAPPTPSELGKRGAQARAHAGGTRAQVAGRSGHANRPHGCPDAGRLRLRSRRALRREPRDSAAESRRGGAARRYTPNIGRGSSLYPVPGGLKLSQMPPPSLAERAVGGATSAERSSPLRGRVLPLSHVAWTRHAPGSRAVRSAPCCGARTLQAKHRSRHPRHAARWPSNLRPIPHGHLLP